jgi:hypothetical protein
MGTTKGLFLTRERRKTALLPTSHEQKILLPWQVRSFTV